jgi:hypothetical protein
LTSQIFYSIIFLSSHPEHKILQFTHYLTPYSRKKLMEV